jgi:hypothetical protein
MTNAAFTDPEPNAEQRQTDPRRLASHRRSSAELTVDELSKMTPAEVDAAFRSGEVAQIPEGEARGTAIFRPGTSIQLRLEPVVRELFWQGKLFNARTKTLKNRILPLGIAAISADVYRQGSWFDGEPCIVLDYSKRSLLARYIRDEIRRVAPGTYLGLVYWGRTRLMYFTLEFPV